LNGWVLQTPVTPLYCARLAVLIIPVWVNSALNGAILTRLNYRILGRLFDINPHFVGILWSRLNAKAIYGILQAAPGTYILSPMTE
jgi:hypothetical protein